MYLNQDLTEVRSLVVGDWTPLSELRAAADLVALTKLHKLKEEELGPHLVGCLASRIAAKDSLWNNRFLVFRIRMATSHKHEVLLTSDNSGQLWNSCVWDPNTGASLTSYKVILLLLYFLPALGNIGRCYFEGNIWYRERGMKKEENIYDKGERGKNYNG